MPLTPVLTRSTNVKRILILVGAVAGLALLAGCGGGTGNTGAKAVPSAVDPKAVPGAVDPNAPEVNDAGDIPDNQVFVAYTPPSGGFSVKVPEGWARSEAGGAVTFTDKLNGVRMEMVDAGSAPTVASVTQTELPALTAATKNFEPGTVKTVTRPAGRAVLATYRADAAPDPVTGKIVHDDVERYAFWRAGKTVILTLSGPQGADNVDPWKIVTDSFGWR
jgi:hypothetical protein